LPPPHIANITPHCIRPIDIATPLGFSRYAAADNLAIAAYAFYAMPLRHTPLRITPPPILAILFTPLRHRQMMPRH